MPVMGYLQDGGGEAGILVPCRGVGEGRGFAHIHNAKAILAGSRVWLSQLGENLLSVPDGQHAILSAAQKPPPATSSKRGPERTLPPQKDQSISGVGAAPCFSIAARTPGLLPSPPACARPCQHSSIFAPRAGPSPDRTRPSLTNGVVLLSGSAQVQEPVGAAEQVSPQGESETRMWGLGRAGQSGRGVGDARAGPRQNGPLAHVGMWGPIRTGRAGLQLLRPYCTRPPWSQSNVSQPAEGVACDRDRLRGSRGDTDGRRLQSIA